MLTCAALQPPRISKPRGRGYEELKICLSAVGSAMFRLGLLIVLAGSLAGCWEGIRRPVLASVLSFDGPRALYRNLGPELWPVRFDTHVGAGAVLVTGPESAISLALLPNTLAQLREGSELEIVELSVNKDGNETGDAMRERVAHVRLLRGSMIVSQEGMGLAEPTLVIDTPHGTFSPDYDGLFSVQCYDHVSRVVCVTGAMSFQPAGSKAASSVDPGFAAEWGSEQAKTFAAETDERAQTDVAEALIAEQRLRGERSLLYDIRPAWEMSN